jgi:hypothetical protein
VSQQIVHDDDVASFKRRGELGFDGGFEDAPVHRRVDDEGRSEGAATQAGNESLGLPMPEGGFGSEALALEAASARARHFGGGPGLVEEDQPVGLEPHLRLERGGIGFRATAGGEVSANSGIVMSSISTTRRNRNSRCGSSLACLRPPSGLGARLPRRR